MRRHIPLRLIAALILLSVAVPLSLSGLARLASEGSQAAFNRLQARSNGALAVTWDTRSEVPDFLSALNPAARLEQQASAIEFFDDSIPRELQTLLAQLKTLFISDDAAP